MRDRQTGTEGDTDNATETETDADRQTGRQTEKGDETEATCRQPERDMSHL